MMVPNVPDFMRVYYAVLSLGAVVVPVHLLLKAEEIAYVLRDAEVDLFVVAAPILGEALPAAAEIDVPVVTVLLPADTSGPAGRLPRLEAEAAASEPIARHTPTRPTDPATILYTSGTTGTPKGAVGSHLAIVEQVHCTLIDSFDLRAEDVVFGGLPLFHTFGQTAVMNVALRAGASIILLPRFDADDALALMVAHGATVFTAVPTMYVGMLEAARRSETRPPLRYAVSGGAALPVVVLEAFRTAFGADVHEGYGLTEAARGPGGARRDRRARSQPVQRLPRTGGRDGCRHRRRLVPDRRSRALCRGGAHDRRPQEGHDRPQRLQRVSDRGR